MFTGTRFVAGQHEFADTPADHFPRRISEDPLTGRTDPDKPILRIDDTDRIQQQVEKIDVGYCWLVQNRASPPSCIAPQSAGCHQVQPPPRRATRRIIIMLTACVDGMTASTAGLPCGARGIHYNHCAATGASSRSRI
ncbi:hypothetical protein C27AD_17833 [Salinisphaera hydrothermalis C27AD]